MRRAWTVNSSMSQNMNFVLLSRSFSMYLTFFLFPKHTSEAVSGTSMLILILFLYFPFPVFLLSVIFWDWLD